MTWQIDEDTEFGGDLLRWNESVVIAQTTGEEQDGTLDAYAALVATVELADALAAHERHGGSIPWPSVRGPFEKWKAANAR